MESPNTVMAALSKDMTMRPANTASLMDWRAGSARQADRKVPQLISEALE
jgi:hypothetical protein